MAKISPVSIKYMVYASFKAEGPLEKPDVIGAIFGQTEGLLGEDLEMRELQKEGRIGRIEVNLEMVDGKSVGEIQLPSALDKSETTIVAAALETIDRIGPTEAHIEIIKIEDVRGTKRDFIVNRAKALLEKLGAHGEISEMTQTVKDEARAAKLQEYGAERLPAGDLSGNEIIVCEGRADVVNMLKNRVNNVIGMNGTKLPAEIAKLGEQKELTLFVDGDRGGKLIARNVISNAKIVYVAVAPDGKEVEELTGKEILMALRKKVPTRVFMARLNGDSYDDSEEVEESAPVAAKPEFSGDVKKTIRDKYAEIRDSRSALLLDSGLNVIRKVSTREVAKMIHMTKADVYAVVIDGSAISSIIRACEERGVKHLAATQFAISEGTSVNLISL
jgi:DNA primase